MKQLKIYLEDSEYKELKKVKKEKTWKQLLLSTLDRKT